MADTAEDTAITARRTEVQDVPQQRVASRRVFSNLLRTILLRVPVLKRLPFSYVRVVLGLVLLAAAGLKAYGLVFDPVSQDSFLASPRLVTAAIEIETLLGLWLLSGWSGRVARFATLGFFVILASVSFYLALTGQPSCGCLGPFTVKPWFIFAFDAAAILGLLTCSPRLVGEFPSQAKAETREAVALNTGRNPRCWLRAVFKIGVGVAAIITVICGILLLTFDDLNEALAWLRGESITVEPGVVQVGEGVEGENRTFILRVKNHKDQPVWIIGGTKRGFCNSTHNLPICLPPRESRDIEITMMFRGGVGCFQQPFHLFSNADKQSVIKGWYTGCVIAPSSR